LPRPLLLLTVGALALAGCVTARPADAPPPADAPRAAAAPGDTARTAPRPIRPYNRVITREAETERGVFATHRVGDRLYFEIPDSTMGREMLLATRIARTADQIGYGGERANHTVVRWERNGERQVLLRVVSYNNVATPDQPIYEAVRNANFEPIIGSFTVEAFSPDSSAVVIEVTRLFTDDVPMLGLQRQRREAFKVRRLDRARSFVTAARAFPRNVEVRNVLTYDAGEPPSNAATGTISVEMSHSMVLLPDDPMMPRLCDERVGYFAVRQVDYGSDEHRADRRCFITRWRLEPSDPEAYVRGELVEPVTPITYYIDPATPHQWRPYLKQGVEDWNVAFEAAGFRNAIRALDPPTPEEDPDFDPDDLRYSVIRYFPSPIQNAYGPHIADPRTGEILESNIGWYHNVMRLLRNWYFIQTAAANPDARRTRFDEAVMGELIRFVSAHEVGHTLGLPHNWGSSFAVPVDSLRSPTYTAAHGTAPSIMDYARFNYVAQPGDGVTNFLPRVGAYDEWSVQWGYSVLPEAASPQAERETLNRWVVERADDPRYFFGRTAAGQFDPRSQNEDLGNDAVLASELGLANLRRIVPQLVAWTSANGENFEELQELYGQVVTQWGRYMGHVLTNLGGAYETPRTADQAGMVYEPVPAPQQRRALAFLQDYAFQAPEWLLDDAVLRRIEHSGAIERVRNAQASVLNRLLDPARLVRMIEADALDGSAYGADEMMADLRRGLFAEARRGEAVSVFRRNLQRAYVDRLEHLLTVEQERGVNVAQSDIRSFARAELDALGRELRAAAGRTRDARTVAHYRDALARVETALDPRTAAAARAAAAQSLAPPRPPAYEEGY
jgi:hypothetical protein